MKKKLTLLIFSVPFLIMAQTIDKNGTITFDFGKKRQKTQDSIQQQQSKASNNQDSVQSKKEKKQAASANSSGKQEQKYDFRKDGIFKALVHVGINGCQIDGDGYAGYNLPGLAAGVGALIRFHKNFSTSLEINYTMKGAKQAFVFNANPVTTQQYRVQWDYIEVPVSVNVHDKDIIMASLGLAPAVMVRYKERDENGQTDSDGPGLPPGGWPNKFDLSFFFGLHFIIHKNFALGGKFSYSLIKVRGPQQPGLSKLNGEYNNDITLRFMYIIDTVKKKKG